LLGAVQIAIRQKRKYLFLAWSDGHLCNDRCCEFSYVCLELSPKKKAITGEMFSCEI